MPHIALDFQSNGSRQALADKDAYEIAGPLAGH
jgi:hypothetical protein